MKSLRNCLEGMVDFFNHYSNYINIFISDDDDRATTMSVDDNDNDNGSMMEDIRKLNAEKCFVLDMIETFKSHHSQYHFIESLFYMVSTAILQ